MSAMVRIEARGLDAEVTQLGSGEPLLYLHGFADIHGSEADWLPFHRELAQHLRVIAPAHPGCGDSPEDDEIDTMEDVVFHYLHLLDSMTVGAFHLAGSSIGGWIATELAVRIPERIKSLTLLGATGLFLPGQPIADLFMLVQPENGGDARSFRRAMFGDASAPAALAMFPDGAMAPERDSRRYRMFRFASRVGFSPPYFHNRKLRGRLPRYRGPALVLAGREDHFVPVSHAQAYAQGLPNATLDLLAATGHSVIVEQPGVAARIASLARG